MEFWQKNMFSSTKVPASSPLLSARSIPFVEVCAVPMPHCASKKNSKTIKIAYVVGHMPHIFLVGPPGLGRMCLLYVIWCTNFDVQCCIYPSGTIYYLNLMLSCTTTLIIAQYPRPTPWRLVMVSARISRTTVIWEWSNGREYNTWPAITNFHRRERFDEAQEGANVSPSTSWTPIPCLDSQLIKSAQNARFSLGHPKTQICSD